LARGCDQIVLAGALETEVLPVKRVAVGISPAAAAQLLIAAPVMSKEIFKNSFPFSFIYMCDSNMEFAQSWDFFHQLYNYSKKIL